MRGLFRDALDNMPFVVEIVVAGYDPLKKMLWFTTANDDDISIPDVEKVAGQEIIFKLYSDGMINTVDYQAYLNEVL